MIIMPHHQKKYKGISVHTIEINQRKGEEKGKVIDPGINQGTVATGIERGITGITEKGTVIGMIEIEIGKGTGIEIAIEIKIGTGTETAIGIGVEKEIVKGNAIEIGIV